MQVLAAERPDPRPLALGDLRAVQHAFGGAARHVRCDGRRGKPLLRQPLRAPVERRRDPVAAALEVGVGPEDRLELATDLPREVASRDTDRAFTGQDDGLLGRGAELVRLERGPSSRGGDPLEDPVAPDDRRRSRGHDEAALGVRHGEAVRVERRRGLGQAGQERGLGDRQCGQVGDAEVDLGGRSDAVRPVPVEDLVEVGGHDTLLAGLAGILVAQAQRLDDLLDLADIAIRPGLDDVVGQQSGTDELLGDGRCAALAGAGRVLSGGGDQRRDVDAGVVPERAVLGGGRRVEHGLGDRIEGEDATSLVLESPELDLAGAVVDDRRLGEPQVVQLARIREPG